MKEKIVKLKRTSTSPITKTTITLSMILMYKTQISFIQYRHKKHICWVPIAQLINYGQRKLENLRSEMCSVLTQFFPREVKRPWREADHSPSISGEVKNTWDYTRTSTPPYAFRA
jgi:hypothetical protein